MEKNHILGFILLFSTLLVWTYLNKPSEAEIEKMKYTQDSLALVQIRADSLENLDRLEVKKIDVELPDSLLMIANQGIYGPFASSTIGKEELFTLENEKIKLTFSNKGGKIVSAFLKDYQADVKGSKGEKRPVILLDNPKNRFEYLIPIANVPSGTISTEDLFFDVNKQGNTLTFTSKSETGATFKQKYVLDDGYGMDYSIDYSGIKNLIDNRSEGIMINWENHLSSYELNDKFEKQYSAIYFKESGASNPEDCGCLKDEKEEINKVGLDWVSNSNQYFNSSLIASTEPFSNAKVESTSQPEEVDYMEKLSTKMYIPNSASGKFDMTMYVGPNEYDRLKSYGVGLEGVIPFGSNIFGTINKYMIRPLFDFFSSFLGSLGFAIILVIFLIKMALYPLMYKMLHSQALMGALKPEIDNLTAKYKDDMQTKQMETMKIYREYGVSPLGGCMPMLVQMPIWYALFRFFPASISFRQESFLWANDLSSYDAFFNLPFHIPFMGNHLSLFTILWAISTLVYTYYNTKHMDMSANPAMKYMQYFMPIMFLGFFNTYASGLTAYMFFSNLINIIQTVLTKKFVFKDEKLRQELAAKKAKPKKTGGFQAKLEEAMKQQQAMQQTKKGK